MSTVHGAENKCGKKGSRLYQLRSLNAINYFKNSEKFHMGESGLFPYALSRSHIALGMKYTKSLKMMKMMMTGIRVERIRSVKMKVLPTPESQQRVQR